MHKPSISIFFPFLNDWGTVGSLIALAIASAEKISDDWEVIIINDGSSKENREALGMVVNKIKSEAGNQKPEIRNRKSETGNQKQEKRIRIVDHAKNRGYGGALRSGFENCTKDLIFYTDCDAQYDPRELSKLYEALKPNIGMVNGYKIKRNDPLYRTIMGRIYHYTVKFMFKLPIRDTDCDFRLIKREVFDPSASSRRTPVRLFESTGTICTELVKKIDHAGYKIAEVPVHHYWRTSGKSQFFNFKRLYKTATNLLKLWWKLRVRNRYNS